MDAGNVGDNSGIDARTIQRAESVQNLALESLKAIANAFETTIDQLSKDHQEAALTEVRAKYAMINLQALEQAADLCRLFGTHAYRFQRVGTYTDHQEMKRGRESFLTNHFPTRGGHEFVKRISCGEFTIQQSPFIIQQSFPPLAPR